MTVKAKGGRGHKAENPYERFTVSLPPDLKVWLDQQAQQQGVTRSEALASLLTQVKEADKKPQPAIPQVLPGTPQLFFEIEPQPTEQKPAPRTTPTPPQSDTAEVALTLAQRQIRGALKVRGSIADYDFYERKWSAGFARVPATLADLEELTRLGLLTKTGEGQTATYCLAEN